jgi:hypothetical protein
MYLTPVIKSGSPQQFKVNIERSCIMKIETGAKSRAPLFGVKFLLVLILNSNNGEG